MPHAIVPETVNKQSKLEKFGRVAEHICFALSGVVLFRYPPETVRDSVWWLVIPVLAAFLFLAGSSAAISSWRGKFKTEYVAVIFIGAAVTIITMSLWVGTFINHKPTMAVFALILSALCLKLLSRFGTLNRYVKDQLRSND